MMTDTTINDKKHSSSDELIAQAYAAVKGASLYDKPLAPAYTPTPVEAPPTEKTPQQKSAARPPQPTASTTPAPAVPKVPKARPHIPSPTQPPAPTGRPAAPVAKPVKPSKQVLTTSSGTLQTDIPYSQNTQPARRMPATRYPPVNQSTPPQAQAPHTQSVSPRPQNTPSPQRSRPTPPPTPKKRSGWGTMLIWLAIIFFLFWLLPNIQYLD